MGATRVLAGLMVAALVAGGMAVSAGAQTGDLTAWCQARVDVEAAFSSEDESAISAALEALSTTAPPDIASDSATVAQLLGELGEEAFEDPTFNEALAAVEAYVLANCGFNVVEVSAIDYEFDGLPDTVPAGITAFSLTNDAPREQHEIVIFRVNDDVELSAKKLLSLPEKKVQKKVTFAGAAFADPGATQTTVADLESGRYVASCFIPVGGKKKGAPHFTKGMFTEFEVEAE
ncbi:MAG: hypothetical protein R6X23_11765 [Acidimicrobiia bacterium]